MAPLLDRLHVVSPKLDLPVFAALRGWWRRDVVEHDRQMPRAAQDRVGPVGRWIGDQHGILRPTDEFGQGDLRLRSGQGGVWRVAKSPVAGSTASTTASAQTRKRGSQRSLSMTRGG
jgi:hypothetical protein